MIEEKVRLAEVELKDIFNKVDETEFYNSKKVLDAFKKNNLSEIHFNVTSGYGYDDIGPDTIERIYVDIFKCEDALVRRLFISGSHVLTVCLFELLRPGDLMLSISVTPYDTLHEVIVIKENVSSLKSFGVNYDEIDLLNNDFDYEKIESYLKKTNLN